MKRDGGTPVADRVREYTKAQQKRGLMQAKVWIPESRMPDLKRYAERLRREEELPLPSEDWCPWLKRR